MRGKVLNACRVGVVVSTWLLLPTLVFAQPPDIKVAATTDQKRPIDLSDTLRVTLTIEGPAPLRIEFQKSPRGNGAETEQILVDESNRDWKIARIGAPIRTPLGTDRERWVQVFQLEPYVARGPTTILFAPIRVNNSEIPGPGCDVTVNPPAIDAKAGAAMAITGIEELPQPAASPRSSRWWVWISLLIAVGIGVAIGLRHPPPSRVNPGARMGRRRLRTAGTNWRFGCGPRGGRCGRGTRLHRSAIRDRRHATDHRGTSSGGGTGGVAGRTDRLVAAIARGVRSGEVRRGHTRQ